MMLRSYRLYNNDINAADFEDDLNPLGFEIGQRKDKIMPYNKAHNKINVLIGELLKRPFNYKAIFTSIEGAYAIKDEKMRLVKEYVISQIQKEGELAYLEGQEMAPEELQAKQQELEQKYAGVMNPEQIDDYLAKTYNEPREIKSNKILANLVKKINIPDKKKDSFKHGLLSDEEHCWVGVVNGKPTLKVLNPIGVVFEKAPDVKYVQDGSFAGYRTVMPLADILDTYKNLKAKDIKKLEELYTSGATSSSNGEHYQFPHLELQYNRADNRSHGAYGIGSGDDIEVFHCEWRSQRKLGFLTYIDEEGEVQTDMVDENFIFDKEDPKNVSIEWDWVPEIWEGTKIGAGTDLEAVYVDIQPVPYQEVDVEDPYYQPLRYHGVTYNNMNTSQISTMERMRPFQFLFFIVMHRMKHLLARDRGKVMPVDVSKIDPRYTIEETLFYLDEMDVFIHNSLSGAESPGAAHRSGLDNGIDRSNAQHIVNYINILNYLDEQIGEVAGVTRAREGQTSPYDAVTNTQQSIMQSSTITELLFSVHTCHWEKVLNSLLDLAIRVDNENGGLYSSIESDFTKSVYNVKKGEMDNCKFNVFVVDNPKDNEVFRQIQGLAQPLLQNDKARFSQIIKLLKQSYSIEELTKDIESFEAVIDKQNEQRYQQEQQMMQKQQQDAQNAIMMKMNHEASLNKDNNETKIRVAEITAFMGQQDLDADNNGVPDPLEIERLKHEIATSEQDRVLEQHKMNVESQENDKDRQLKREEMRSKEKIAKSKPKPKSTSKK